MVFSEILKMIESHTENLCQIYWILSALLLFPWSFILHPLQYLCLYVCDRGGGIILSFFLLLLCFFISDWSLHVIIPRGPYKLKNVVRKRQSLDGSFDVVR